MYMQHSCQSPCQSIAPGRSHRFVIIAKKKEVYEKSISFVYKTPVLNVDYNILICCNGIIKHIWCVVKQVMVKHTGSCKLDLNP